jgi:hypothetical protein
MDFSHGILGFTSIQCYPLINVDMPPLVKDIWLHSYLLLLR